MSRESTELVLAAIARYLETGPVSTLEIGTAGGYTTNKILQKIAKSNGSVLYACDPFVHYGEKTNRDHQLAYEVFMEKTREYQAAGKLYFRREKSFDFLQQLISDRSYHKTFDVVFIDGNHTARFVLEDFILSYPLAKEGAIFVLDDYNWVNKYVESPGTQHTPKLAIDVIRIVFSDKIKLLNEDQQGNIAGHAAVFQKIE